MKEQKHLHFTPDEIKSVQSAIRKANQDMEQWRKDSEPTPERMRQKINVFRNGKAVRE